MLLYYIKHVLSSTKTVTQHSSFIKCPFEAAAAMRTVCFNTACVQPQTETRAVVLGTLVKQLQTASAVSHSQG